MGTPTRQNSYWLFDEVTQEFSEDTLPLDNELLLAPSSPLVQPACVETARDAPLLTVNTRGRVVFTKRV